MPDRTPREQLDAILSEHVDYWEHDHRKAVDVAISEGWRPPARVITDPAELDALPGRSVVITPAGYLWRHERPGARLPWRLDGHLDGTAADVLRGGRQSVTVLHTPENGDTNAQAR